MPSVSVVGQAVSLLGSAPFRNTAEIESLELLKCHKRHISPKPFLAKAIGIKGTACQPWKEPEAVAAKGFAESEYRDRSGQEACGQRQT